MVAHFSPSFRTDERAAPIPVSAKEYGDLYEQGKAKFKERNVMLEEHREKILQEIKTQKKYLKMVEAKIEMKI